MNLEYISKKIDSILNFTGTSAQQYADGNPLAREGFYFRVATEGYYLDSITDANRRKNVILVFVGAMGGENNPVPDLNESDLSVPISIYFPIKYKKDFYKLDKYLTKVFVGKIVDFGKPAEGTTPAEIDNALCTIDVSRYTTIADAGLIEFKNWTNSSYGMAIDTADFWMQLSTTLYLNSIEGMGQAGGYLMGNEVKITNITIKHWVGDVYTTVLNENNPVIIQRADISSSEPAVQQLFSDTHTKGFAANAGYTRQIPLMIRKTSGYRSLLNYIEVTKDIQNLSVELTEVIPFNITEGGTTYTDLTVTNTYFITNYTRTTSMGEILGINLTLADRR